MKMNKREEKQGAFSFATAFALLASGIGLGLGLARWLHPVVTVRAPMLGPPTLEEADAAYQVLNRGWQAYLAANPDEAQGWAEFRATSAAVKAEVEADEAEARALVVVAPL